MNRVSHFLTGCMLALLLLLVDLSVLLGTLGNLQHRSYVFALGVGLLLAVGAFWLSRRQVSVFERWGVKRTGWILALGCFGVNLLWVLLVKVPIFGDSRVFWQTALALAADEPVEHPAYLALFPHILGYSSALSLVLRVFGGERMAAFVLNVCLCTLSGLFLYRIALRYASLRQAGWAFLLWALWPSKLLYNGMVLSDGLYTCLLLAAFDLLSALERRGLSWKRLLPAAVLAGALLWAVNISRPIGAIVPIALLLWMLFLRGGQKARGRWLALLALLLLVYVPLGRLWDAHIEKLVGEAPARIPGYNIYVGFLEETGGTYSVEAMDMLDSYRNEEGASAVSAQRQMLQEAVAHIRSGTIRFPRLFAAKLRNLLGDDEGGAYSLGGPKKKLYRPTAVLSNIFYYGAVLLANLGAWRLWRRRREQRFVLCLPLFALGLILAQMLVEVSIRYHYSLIPVLILLSAYGLTREIGGNHA